MANTQSSDRLAVYRLTHQPVNERTYHEYRSTTSLFRIGSLNLQKPSAVDLSLTSRLASRKRLVAAMTNSAPKMSDKVERQGSPNNGGKRQSNRSASIRTTTYFSSASSATKANSNNSTNGNTNAGNVGNTTRNTNGRVACSSPCIARNARNSPSRSAEQSPRGSPTGGFYAGAKFSEPPSPASLPKPPSHWTTRLMTSCKQSETCCNISNHLKMILNVQAS